MQALEKQPLRVAVVGCGTIASGYGETLQLYAQQIQLVGATDVDASRAETFVETYGGWVYPSLEAILADETVDLVLNLTIHQAHFAVIQQCLHGGKDVLSEKPLALTTEEAQTLVALARQKGRRLGCAPSTILGEVQQTLWKAIRDELTGPLRLAYAEVNWGRIESWHPAPGPFYEVGALFDVGVYPLTILTTIFGPARRVSGFGTVLHPNRQTHEGVSFQIETPDLVVAAIEFANGAIARLTTNFYVGHHSKQQGIEFHGDRGSLYVSDWLDSSGTIEFAEFGGIYQPVPYVKQPPQGPQWCRGLLDMADAIAEQRPHRLTGEQAAHVVELMCAIKTSYEHNRPVEVTSVFPQPAPMEWAV